MKILMTGDAAGGVWTYALDLARGLGGHGIEVALATMGADLRPEQRRAAGEIPSLTLWESTYKLEWMEDPWQDVQRAGEWLLEIESIVQPDVIHLNGYVHGALAWSHPVVVVGHSCVRSWWQAVERQPMPATWDTYRKAVARGLASADMVIAPTRAVLRALSHQYGLQPGARVIPNGRDSSLYRPGPKEPFILAAGRLWDAAKNVATLARCAAQLDWPVFVAGASTSPDGRETRVDGVSLLGALSPVELAGRYARAGIYCLPARYEPFGLSVLEAALSGCALVVGDIDSLREVWGDAAMYTPPDDAEALAAALNRLSRSPALRAEMADRAKARARRYTVRQMTESYRAVYRELIPARTRERVIIA